MTEKKRKPKAGKKLPNEGVADKKKKRVKKRVETYNIVFNELCKTGNRSSRNRQENLPNYMMETNERRSMQIRQMPIERLEMKWRTEHNNKDCGIFAIRHMETYMGTATSKEADEQEQATICIQTRHFEN